MYEHRFLENINKLYKYSGKFDNQQHYKAIIETETVSNPEGFTDNSKISPSQSVIVENPSARKSLCQFQNHCESNLRLLSAGYVLLNQK